MQKVIFIMNLAVVALILRANPLPEMMTQSYQKISITSPVEGEVVTGIVNIIGTSKTTGFTRSVITFSNATESMETWFPISESSKSVQDDLLFSWDTTIITDGDYKLRLQVFNNKGSIDEYIIPKISILNYTPVIAFSTPLVSASIFPTETRVAASETPTYNPTRLPKNPLALSTNDLVKSMLIGIISILGLIGISTIYSRLQNK